MDGEFLQFVLGGEREETVMIRKDGIASFHTTETEGVVALEMTGQECAYHVKASFESVMGMMGLVKTVPEDSTIIRPPALDLEA